MVGQTDVGFDLYCESVIDSRPFLHFWGQVKSSEEFANEAVEVFCPFKVSALKYWSRQPVPVLSFLVPLKLPPEEIRYIHVVGITFDILEHGIRHDQEWQTLKSKPALILPVADREQLSVKLRGLMVDHLETLGVAGQARTDAAGAKAHSEKAILCIQNDPEINSTKPPWSESIAGLNARIQSLGSVGNVGSGGQMNSPATERG